ncbi:MAG: hypothetical protein ACJAZB_001701 [Psychrosphaera sp.]|jgi:hypothetical protein
MFIFYQVLNALYRFGTPKQDLYEVLGFENNLQVYSPFG